MTCCHLDFSEKLSVKTGVENWQWYEHQPEVKGATILWDFAIQTSRKIKSHRPDIVVKDNKRKNAF